MAQATLRNQRTIITNQRVIVRNQTKILRNQKAIIQNPRSMADPRALDLKDSILRDLGAIKD